VTSIIDFYGKDAGNFSEVAGPGNFNDPDMVCTLAVSGVTIIKYTFHFKIITVAASKYTTRK